MSEVDKWGAPCDADKRWVCAACGRTTELGGVRYDLRDSSCIMHAVLCWAERRDNKWQAVTP